MTNFGASFKKARESQGISLNQIASETRISTRFLSAIENEEFHLLPGGIFNRGFVRTFAERIGLDPNQAVADYERLAEVREPSETLAAASTQSSKTGRNLYPAAIGALALTIFIFYVVTRESAQTAQTANPPPPPPAVAQPAPPTLPPATTAAASTPQSQEPEPAPPAPAQAITLDIQTSEPTWIKITADGKTLDAGEILEPGMTRKFAGQNSIGIILGNAGGVALKLNGMPMKALGKSGQVREITITPANLKDFIG